MAWRTLAFFRRSRDSALEGDVPVIYNRGTRFSASARHAEALYWYESALAIDPDYANAHYGCGAALAELGRHEEAACCFERAYSLSAEFVNAYYGRAVCLTALNRHAEAIACYDHVLARRPDCVDALYGRGLCLLASGDLPRGFEGLEYRDRLPHQKSHVMSFPSKAWWGDASLANKTILLHLDGGFGDAIQFVRFAPLLAKRGARVILRVPQKLLALMRAEPFVYQAVSEDEPLPQHDFHCPLVRLPLVLGTTLDTIPASRGYLRADAARVLAWRKRLGPQSAPRVGLAWAGSKFNRTYNGRRSIPFEALRSLADLDCEWISLQSPIPKADRTAIRAMPRLNLLGESLKDFAEIAGVIENLDLVIAVDSSIAHLAGALGKPVWLLLCYTPDWRWLTDRTDSPWYPSARLFRQNTPGDWSSVVADVKRAWRAMPDRVPQHSLETVECQDHK
ncbi:MAG TPA: tetratricopeptide repeat-containing glycosyltransferase family protein [Bryobacteraceae bacterium]|nr:tetratricopeptide repeat-containing glycosyltransferase family protein [Bryobacteraceae bacterium]